MKKIFPIIVLALISVFIIFYRFVDIPKYLSFDEVEFTKLALSLNNKPYIPYSQLATGHSTLYFYILLSSLKNFGVNIFALRFPAAIFGVLSIFVFYLIIKRIFKQQLLSFLLALTLLSSHWFINFSRFSFEATFLLFLELTSIYFIFKFDEDPRSSFYLIMSGLFAGLAFISYTPGRIFFLLPVGFTILSFPRRRESSAYGSPIKSGMTNILLFLIPFIIITTPLIKYLLTNKDTRIDQQFFLNNHEMPVSEKLTGLWKNISSTALMFNVKGDVNGRHNYPNKPALNPIFGILFVAGLIISIKDFKNLYNKLFLFYFLISLIPAIMTYSWENPIMLRTYTSLPAIVYFVGLATLFFINLFSRMIKVKVPKFLISYLLFFMLIISSIYELRTYFKYQSTVFNQSFEIKLPLEKAIKVKNP
jgi:4-amino-4-deoxy-L-arabinose transferase-like glycosyltransferase